MPDARPFLLLALLMPAQAAEITVDATRSGETFRVEASAEFEGSLTRAWKVLTDYGRFAEFVPDLRVSRVVSRESNSVVVEQKGAARLLFWSYPMDVRLAVTEFPYERVESRSVSGNFREMQNAYTLEMRSGQVHLRYSGRMVPDFYVPPLIGTLALHNSVESTFRALVNEMERVPEPTASDPPGPR
ncbi:MAG TPA: SRPBCC family protein [Burkholderiales bacterium]|nr:SRPBCC family protein [Burkholderiales bacterium]